MQKKYGFFNYIIPLIAGIGFFTASCKKDLYQGPISSTYSSKFWTSKEAAEQSTLAMYGQLRACLRNAPAYNKGEASHFVFGDLVTGVFLPAHDDVFLSYSLKASLTPPFNFSYVPYGEGSLQNWSRFYQLIAQANLVLQNVPKMPASLFANENMRNNYLGEALFMRAYAYFYIIRVWGDPVFVTQTYDDVDYGRIQPLARTPEAKVLDSCLTDLKKAASYLNYAGGDLTKSIRANRGSTEALIAHMYAWKHQYDSAHVYCQKVINNGGYSLEPMSSYTNIWKGQSSNESIFELSMQYNANDPNFKGQGDWAEAQFDCFATFLKDDIVDSKKKSCWIAPIGGLLDNTLFDTAKDARYRSVIRKVAASGGDNAGYMLLKYTNFAYQSPDTKTYPYLNNNLVLFRLSDIYLLDAEAQAYLNNLSGAAAALAATENRAGISSYRNPASSYDMIDEVVMERGRELIGEGQWFYDLIRTEPTQGWLEYVGYPADRVNATNKGYYWPLDMTALFPYDNLLTQNPWWAAHK